MPVLMSQTDYAVHRGVSQPRISVLVGSGQIPDDCIVQVGRYRQIDRDKADKALETTLDKIYNPPNKMTKAKKQESSTIDAGQQIQKAGLSGMSFSDAQRLQAQLKAALLKLDLDERNGKLIKSKTVEKDSFDMYRRVRDAILNVPNRIAPELVGLHDMHTITERLTAELIKALEELSSED